MNKQSNILLPQLSLSLSLSHSLFPSLSSLSLSFFCNWSRSNQPIRKLDFVERSLDQADRLIDGAICNGAHSFRPSWLRAIDDAIWLVHSFGTGLVWVIDGAIWLAHTFSSLLSLSPFFCAQVSQRKRKRERVKVSWGGGGCCCSCSCLTGQQLQSCRFRVKSLSQTLPMKGFSRVWILILCFCGVPVLFFGKPFSANFAPMSSSWRGLEEISENFFEKVVYFQHFAPLFIVWLIEQHHNFICWCRKIILAFACPVTATLANKILTWVKNRVDMNNILQ